MEGIRGYALHPGQVQAIMDGLRTRIQLLLGPPGTGKTMTTAVSILCKILLKHAVGDILLISGNTHRAVDELLIRVHGIVEAFRKHAHSHSYQLPPVFIGKACREDTEAPYGIEPLPNYKSTPVKQARREHVVLIGGNHKQHSKTWQKTGEFGRIQPNRIWR